MLPKPKSNDKMFKVPHLQNESAYVWKHHMKLKNADILLLARIKYLSLYLFLISLQLRLYNLND
jgi:hypothetical protein